MLKLKRYNETKSEMAVKLADSMKFVRDLQKATGDAGSANMEAVASAELQEDYKREQEIHK